MGCAIGGRWGVGRVVGLGLGLVGLGLKGLGLEPVGLGLAMLGLRFCCFVIDIASLNSSVVRNQLLEIS